MSDKSIEKSFLYLILLSILFHVAAFCVVALIPPEPPRIPKDTTMVELKDLPEPPPVAAHPEPKSKPRPKRLRLPVLAKEPILPPLKGVPQGRKEAAPKGNSTIDRIVQSKSLPNLPGKTEPNPPPARSAGKTDSAFRTPEEAGKQPVRGEGLLKPHRGPQTDLAKLFPSARSMEKKEESLRKKFLEAEQGDTRLMDTDDPVIGVFSHRYKIATLNRLNSIDADSRKGLGMTVLSVTFKRDGTIDDITILYSTGNKALDELAIKATRTASYVGPLPRGWKYEVYKMILPFVIDQGRTRASTGWELTE